MATKLPALPDVERLSGSVVRILGGNSNKFTLQGTNTYLLGTNPSSLILLDTAQGFSSWRDNLSSHLSSQTPTPKIKKCLLTHWHLDHVLGVPDLLSLSPGTTLHKGMGTKLDVDNNLKDFDVQDIEDGDIFSDEDGFEVQALHCPGHTEDHMAFVITKSKFEDELGSIFTGDNVLGHGTSVFENLAVYLSSLAKMKERVVAESSKHSRKIVAYPAHGVVIPDAQAKIEEYISHRKTREDEALNVLRYGSVTSSEGKNEGSGTKEWGSMEMVKVIYKAVPEHLHQPAERGLLMVLEKLKGEGRVVQTDDGKWRVSEKATL